MIAAVDLGSHSFHLIVARMLDNELRVVDRLRERVRLAASLDDEGNLEGEASKRALECVQRIGERIRNLVPGHVRAVGTNTFRRARNGRAFLDMAEALIGHPIEIVSGQEEARLIYQGVAHSVPMTDQRRLVIDIGGGSTETILGQGYEVLGAESIGVGCVSWTMRFFANGRLTAKRFNRARDAAGLEFAPVASRLQQLTRRKGSWDVCLGASGTIHAASKMLIADGLGQGPIEIAGLRALVEKMLAADSLDSLSLPGLKPDRKPVLPGGMAVLLAAMETFGVQVVQPAPGALREGLMFDLHSRLREEDMRDRTIKSFVERFDIDMQQGERVSQTARDMLSRVRNGWSLPGRQHGKVLDWASRIHEIGLSISHSGYHRHGEYLVAHAAMPGFSNDDQKTLAALVRSHRRKPYIPGLADLPHLGNGQAVHLCIVLRLAVLLNRARGAHPLPEMEVQAEGSVLQLRFPDGWLQTHPLTAADLRKEAGILKGVGYTLKYQ